MSTQSICLIRKQHVLDGWVQVRDNIGEAQGSLLSLAFVLELGPWQLLTRFLLVKKVAAR